MAASNPGFESQDGRDCLSTDDVLAHLGRRLEGARLQAVQEHLDVCDACRVVMAEAARIATSATPVRTPRTLADGETVAGRYEIRRYITRGGMGEVYEAFDSALKETIALKTIVVTAVDQADAVKRLLAEVRIARKVTHPNVCRILEFGTHQRAGSTDEPVPFLTMPLLTGETLGRRIQRNGPLPPREALRVLRELAAGLAAVHEVGVVHRDFKSDNVFLVRGDDGNERAVVMDFGLARALKVDGDRGQSTSRVLIGTPAYMAPEQFHGNRITKAVDVYAFGVVAFEIVTGRVPFAPHSGVGVGLARMERLAAPPSSAVAGLDRAWDDFIHRCLRRVADQRYANTAELLGALDRLSDGPRRRSWRPATALTLAGAIMALAAWAVVRPSRPSAASAKRDVASEIEARGTPVQVSTVASPAAAPVAPHTDVVPTPPPALAIKHELPGRARRRSPPLRAAQAASPAAVGAPTPAPPPSRPADNMQPDAALFPHPAGPRQRHADDLIDPF